MRSFRHWTPRYLWNRIGELIYRWRYPGDPWLTPAAIRILDGYLTASDVGLEYGSGRSTLWFAKRVGQLTSVEHSRAWYERVSRMLEREPHVDVRLRHIPTEKDLEDPSASDYVCAVDEFEPESVDFVLVDGLYRADCARRALDVLRPGGVLILDNANRYLPSDSVSPFSRSHPQGPDGPMWRAFGEAVRGWHRVWTSSGVFDTALYFKPYDT